MARVYSDVDTCCIRGIVIVCIGELEVSPETDPEAENKLTDRSQRDKLSRNRNVLEIVVSETTDSKRGPSVEMIQSVLIVEPNTGHHPLTFRLDSKTAHSSRHLH